MPNSGPPGISEVHPRVRARAGAGYPLPSTGVQLSDNRCRLPGRRVLDETPRRQPFSDLAVRQFESQENRRDRDVNTALGLDGAVRRSCPARPRWTLRPPTSTSGRWDSVAEDLIFGGGEESQLDVLVRGAVGQSGDPAGAGRVGVAVEQGAVEIGDPGGGVFGRGEESGDHISGAAAGLQG